MIRLLTLLLALAAVACAPDQPEAPEGPRTYEATGTVIGVEGERVLIDHEDIPGFMDAMTMSFPVSDPTLLEGVVGGMRVSFRIVVDGASYAIDRIEARE